MKRISISSIYEVLSNGDIISHGKGKPILLKGAVTAKGYIKHQLVNEDGVKEMYYAHRVVASQHLPDFSNALQVDHKDAVKTNNNVSNLRMVTNSENQLHAVAMGKKPSNAKRIGKYTKDGVTLLEEFDNGTLAGEAMGKCSANILRSCRNAGRKAFGFKWKFL